MTHQFPAIDRNRMPFVLNDSRAGAGAGGLVARTLRSAAAAFCVRITRLGQPKPFYPPRLPDFVENAAMAREMLRL